MVAGVESMTKGVHYIRDKASPLGHESENANTRLTTRQLRSVNQSRSANQSLTNRQWH
jgi:hypothetical protein